MGIESRNKTTVRFASLRGHVPPNKYKTEELP